MRHFYKLLTLLLTGTFLLLPTTAFAELQAYDRFTGEAVYDDISLNNTIGISRNCDYVRTEQAYVYTTSPVAESKIKSSAFSGMVTTDSVSLTAEKNANMIVYRDGVQLSDEAAKAGQFGEIGSYKVFANNDEVMNFQIVNSTTGKLTLYAMPVGFSIRSATCDGVSADFTQSLVSFEKEGDYEVKYACTETGSTYTLRVKIDNTAPQITLLGVENGFANGPVKVIDLEDGAKLSILLDGASINPTTELKEVGNYQLTVTDTAGNSTRYIFSIKFYLNISAIAAIAIVTAIIAVLVGYIVFSRKHLRIR